MSKDEPKRKVRNYTPKQLEQRPLTVPTCEGELVISARIRKGRMEVCVARPTHGDEAGGEKPCT
jgi:hypothetical protein